MPRFNPSELKRLLRDYWLVGEVGEMADSVDKCVNSYLSDIPLALLRAYHTDTPRLNVSSAELDEWLKFYWETDPIPNITKTLTALGIKYTFHIWRPDVLSESNPYPALPNQPFRGSKAVIPEMHERLDDFEMLAPYYFRRIGKELNEQHSVKVTRIEGLFPLYLRFLLKWNTFTMADIIRGAIIEAHEKNGIVSISDSLDRQFLPTYKTLRDFLTEFKELSSVVRMYSQTSFAITCIGTAAKNLAYHIRKGDNTVDEKVRECLEMRVRHRSETSIRKKLGFSSKNDYDAWLADNHIDIASKTHSNILEKWEQARETLFRDHGTSETESVEPAGTSNGSKTIESVAENDSSPAAQKLLIDENDYQVIAIYDEFSESYAFKDGNYFEMVLFIAKRMKIGNLTPQKSSILSAGNIKPEPGKSVSLKTLFTDKGGDPKKFASKFLKSVGSGKWTINIDVNLIEIQPVEVLYTEEEEDSDE